MKQLAKKLGGVFLALCMVLTLLPTVAFAANATTLKSTIENYNSNLTATVDGSTVTVTGTATGVTSILTLDIDQGVKVVWKASITTGDNFQLTRLINLTGTGTFEVAEGGRLESPTTTILAVDDVIISGGEVISNSTGTSSSAIYSKGNVTVSGGMVSAVQGYAIEATGEDSAVTVSGGTVSSDTGSAIYATGDSATVMVSGGIVKNAAQYESYPVIYMKSTSNISDNVTVSGTGKVQATVGGNKAIKTAGNVLVEGSAEVRAISCGISTSGNVTVNGGTVSAGGVGGYAIMAEGTSSVVTVGDGSVSCEASGRALYAYGDTATVTVSGGTVSAIGNGVAIYVPGTNPTVTVSGGTISSDTNYAINIGRSNLTDSASGNVMVTGAPSTQTRRLFIRPAISPR